MGIVFFVFLPRGFSGFVNVFKLIVLINCLSFFNILLFFVLFFGRGFFLGGENTLEKIKEAEFKAEKLLIEAQDSAKTIVESARNEAELILSGAELNASAESEKVLAKAMVSVELKKKSLFLENGKKIQSLRQDSKPKIERESDFLYGKFLKVAGE